MINLINLSDLNLNIQWLLIFILIIIYLKDLNYNSFVFLVPEIPDCLWLWIQILKVWFCRPHLQET